MEEAEEPATLHGLLRARGGTREGLVLRPWHESSDRGAFMDGVIRQTDHEHHWSDPGDLRFDPSTFMTQWTAARVKTRIERTESAIATAPTTARLRAANTGASLMPQMSCGERALLARDDAHGAGRVAPSAATPRGSRAGSLRIEADFSERNDLSWTSRPHRNGQRARMLR